MDTHLNDQIRREAFVQGFVAARDPRTPRDTLRTLEEADRAFVIYAALRASEQEDAV